MSSPDVAPFTRETFAAQDLVAAYPPRLRNGNKKAVYDIACPPGEPHAGELHVSRWPAFAYPEVRDRPPVAFEHRPDVFGYEPPGLNAGATEWYLNFAAAHAFCSYGSSLLAQDELQVAEHPALASLHESLLAADVNRLRTVAAGEPTPVLVRGVERRCVLRTDRNPAEGRPAGLYGNQFAAAPVDVVRRATVPIRPPTVSNIIAIEAPTGETGAYTSDQIDFILRTAYSGFRAAVLDSPNGSAVVIHTGYWGCGAYGGNRILMSLIQLVAAELARVGRMVFHTVTPDGAEPYLRAKGLFTDVMSGDRPPAAREVVERMTALGFEWGVGDGT